MRQRHRLDLGDELHRSLLRFDLAAFVGGFDLVFGLFCRLRRGRLVPIVWGFLRGLGRVGAKNFGVDELVAG